MFGSCCLNRVDEASTHFYFTNHGMINCFSPIKYILNGDVKKRVNRNGPVLQTIDDDLELLFICNTRTN